MSWFASTGSAVLLFFLVFGMSATVEWKQLRKQIKNTTALLIGICMQFILLPFVGFLVVKIFQLPAAVGITLLVVTSSPGGSYSNWWCSLFNAELSLSVTMTALSTLLSTVMLPTNLILYTRWTYSSAVVKSLDWKALFMSLTVVLGGISFGLVAAARNRNNPTFRRRVNMLGNLAGISLVTLSLVMSNNSNEDGTPANLWNQDASFYIGVGLPAVLGLGIVTYLTTQLDLEKPERVAVTVESCYQNTGIATSVAITMFSGKKDLLATAVSVPLFYGMVEACMLAVFCITCWKLNWTKAPADENLCVVLYNSYEVEEQERREHEEAIEVVLSKYNDSSFYKVKENGSRTVPSPQAPNDLIFSYAEDGAYVVDEGTLGKISNNNNNNVDNDEDEEEDNNYRLVNGLDSAAGMTNGALHPPCSPTASRCSTVVSLDSNNNEPDVAIMILEMEEEKLWPGRSRFGRALSTVRARATGYRTADPPILSTIPIPESALPLDDDDDDEEEQASSSSHRPPHKLSTQEQHDHPPPQLQPQPNHRHLQLD